MVQHYFLKLLMLLLHLILMSPVLLALLLVKILELLEFRGYFLLYLD